MVGDLFSRLQDARQKIEEAKHSLNSIIIERESQDKRIRVKANANKVITSIEIAEELLEKDDKERLEDELTEVINNALEEAAQKGEEKMKEITKDMLPNFPGLV